MFFMHQFKKFNLPQEILILFYLWIVQSAHPSLSGLVGQPNWNRLQWAVKTAEEIIGGNLPSIQTLSISSPQIGQRTLLQMHHNVNITSSNSPLWLAIQNTVWQHNYTQDQFNLVSSFTTNYILTVKALCAWVSQSLSALINVKCGWDQVTVEENPISHWTLHW